MRVFRSSAVWRLATRLGVAVAVCGGLSARGQVWGADQPTAAGSGSGVSEAAKAEAKTIYTSRCATCHGTAGKGDGAAAAGLNPKPRDLSEAAWQKSVTDEHIEKIIAMGGPAVGKSPLMPPNPDLTSKPDVVKALRMIVRDFGAGAAK